MLARARRSAPVPAGNLAGLRRRSSQAPREPGQKPTTTARALRRCARLAACLVALALAPACACGPEGRRAPAAAEQVAPEGARDAGALASRATAGSDDSQLSEAAARALLARRFREAGFRVRYDVPVTREGAFALTVDGYDPTHRVGFEYVATSERDTDLDASERAALARERTQRLLLVDATDAAGIDAAATRFLAAARADAAGPPE